VYHAGAADPDRDVVQPPSRASCVQRPGPPLAFLKLVVSLDDVIFIPHIALAARSAADREVERRVIQGHQRQLDPHLPDDLPFILPAV